MRTRPQFTLRFLLGFTLLAAIVTYGVVWGRRIEQRRTCEHEFLSLDSRYQIGRVGDPTVVAKASLRLMEAELAVPFSNKRAAAESHLKRMADLDKRAYAHFCDAMFPTSKAHGLAGERSRAVAEMRRAAEELLMQRDRYLQFAALA